MDDAWRRLHRECLDSLCSATAFVGQALLGLRPALCEGDVAWQALAKGSVRQQRIFRALLAERRQRRGPVVGDLASALL